jgi:hypothetical protein
MSDTVQTAAASVKEKIVFVQHMNPTITANEVLDTFDRFGKLTKCERLEPAKDVWMLQFSKGAVCSFDHPAAFVNWCCAWLHFCDLA